MRGAFAGPSVGSKILALFSLFTFWAVPFSPLVAIAAVRRTRQLDGWPRTVAVTSAWLCTSYTLAGAIWVFGFALYLLTGSYTTP